MHYTLNADERALRASLRQFLSHAVPPGRYESICESQAGFDRELWRSLVESGWLDLHAMADLDPEGSAWPVPGVHLAEEYGRHLVPAPVELVAGFLLPVLARLAPGAFGGSGADALAERLPTVCVQPLLPLLRPGRPAAPDEVLVEEGADGVSLTGRLANVQFGASATSLFLPVELVSGWALARMDLQAEGVSAERVASVDPGRTCASVTLSSVRVPADDLVRTGPDGTDLEAILTDALLSYLLVLDGKAIGAAELLLERTVAYVTDRRQFGVPIGSFQAVKHRVADMATALEAGRSLASYTAWQVAQRHDDRVEAVLSSRLYCAAAYRRVCENAIQCHGGMGFTWEVGLHTWYRSAMFDAAVADLTMSDLARLLGGAA